MKALRRKLKSKWNDWRHARLVRAHPRALERLVRVALVGGGKAAQFHLDALRCIRNVQVNALITRGRGNPAPLLNRYEIPQHYTSIADAVKGGGFEAAIVAVPPAATCSLVSQLATAGIRCLVEKPLGLSSEEAAPLLQLDEQGRHAVAYNRRFYSSVIQAREIVASLGSPYSIHIEAPENLHKILSTGNAGGLASRFIANSTHALDLFTSFLGKHHETESLPVMRRLGDIPTSFQTGTRFECGGTGTFLAHWRSPGEWTAALYGELYRLEINLHRNRCVLQTIKAGKEFSFPARIEDELAKPGILSQDWSFLQAVSANSSIREPLCSIRSAFETLRLAESILAAAAGVANQRLQIPNQGGTVSR